jgi:hypothetical protein
MPNIRDRRKLAESLWDWDFLNDCWSGRIRPTDIDGVVERNGYFLFLEGKPANGFLTEGQRITFKALTQSFKTAEVLILYGEPGFPNFYQRIFAGIISEKKPCNRMRIQAICRAWFNAVN